MSRSCAANKGRRRGKQGKLEIAKIATDIVEQNIEDYCKKIWRKEFKYNEKTGERIPFQMFGVALDNKMKKLSYFKGLNKMLNRTTYLEEGIKRPPEPLTMPVIWFETTTKLTPSLFKISKDIWEDVGYPRVLYQVSGELRKDLPYLAAIRIVESKDATRAKPMKVEFEYLQKIGDEIRKKNPLVAAVAYDISTKPPATIEFE